MKYVKTVVSAAAALTVVGLNACASSESAGESGGDVITIGYINWDEDVAATHLWERILTDKGYEVETTQIADAGPAYLGLSNGDYDLFLDGSLPDIHADYWAEYGEDLTDLGAWYDGVTQGIAVPHYMDEVQSLEDLPKVADELDSTIVGIEAGAGLMKSANQMLEDYGLDEQGWTVAASSTAAMLSELDSATGDGDSAAVTLWRPHWAYSTYKVRDLDDPKSSMGDPGQIHSLGSSTFEDDFPEVARMLKNFRMSDQELGSLEHQVIVEHPDDPAAGVDAWLEENPNFVETLS